MPSEVFRPTGKQWNPNFPNSATELNQNRSVIPVVWTLSDEPGDDENLMRFVVRKEPGTTVRLEVPGTLESSSALISGDLSVSAISATSLAVTSTATVGSLNVARLQTYDTGWVANSDWTNVELTATHNLSAPLPELIVKFFISTDGTDATSFEIQNSGTLATAAGHSIFQVSLNAVKVQTGTLGLNHTDDTGATVTINSQSWHYRIRVYRLT